MDLSLPGGLSNTTNIRNDDTFEFERRIMSLQYNGQENQENQQSQWWFPGGPQKTVGYHYEAWDPNEFDVDFDSMPYTPEPSPPAIKEEPRCRSKQE